MGILYEILKIFGFGPRTYVYKFDMGYGFRKKKVKETDAFLKFKEKGTNYIVLKTVPSHIDKNGNKYYFMFESDVHSFDPVTGKVLSEALEGEFKERLKLNEIEKFKEIIKDVEEEAIKERAKDIYETISVRELEKSDVAKVKRQKDEEEEEKEEIAIDITVPTIKLSKTAQIRIDSLTPHDTINEIMSHILDGSVLANLISTRGFTRTTLFGIISVGVVIGWGIMIIFAAFFPDLWRQFWGFGSTNGSGPPTPEGIIITVKWIIMKIRGF